MHGEDDLVWLREELPWIDAGFLPRVPPGRPTFGDHSLELVDWDESRSHGILTVSTNGRTRRSNVERLTPSASAARVRV